MEEEYFLYLLFFSPLWTATAGKYSKNELLEKPSHVLRYSFNFKLAEASQRAFSNSVLTCGSDTLPAET